MPGLQGPPRAYSQAGGRRDGQAPGGATDEPAADVRRRHGRGAAVEAARGRRSRPSDLVSAVHPAYGLEEESAGLLRAGGWTIAFTMRGSVVLAPISLAVVPQQSMYDVSRYRRTGGRLGLNLVRCDVFMYCIFSAL